MDALPAESAEMTRPPTAEASRARAWRERRGYSRERLSELTGYSARTIAQLETGRWANGNLIDADAWRAFRLACAAIEAGAEDFDWGGVTLRFGDVTIIRGE